MIKAYPGSETTLSYASVMGIKKDIKLVKDDYQWLGSMFYFGISENEVKSWITLTSIRVPGVGISDEQTAANATSG